MNIDEEKQKQDVEKKSLSAQETTAKAQKGQVSGLKTLNASMKTLVDKTPDIETNKQIADVLTNLKQQGEKEKDETNPDYILDELSKGLNDIDKKANAEKEKNKAFLETVGGTLLHGIQDEDASDTEKKREDSKLKIKTLAVLGGIGDSIKGGFTTASVAAGGLLAFVTSALLAMNPERVMEIVASAFNLLVDTTKRIIDFLIDVNPFDSKEENIFDEQERKTFGMGAKIAEKDSEGNVTFRYTDDKEEFAKALAKGEVELVEVSQAQLRKDINDMLQDPDLGYFDRQPLLHKLQQSQNSLQWAQMKEAERRQKIISDAENFIRTGDEDYLELLTPKTKDRAIAAREAGAAERERLNRMNLAELTKEVGTNAAIEAVRAIAAGSGVPIGQLPATKAELRQNVTNKVNQTAVNVFNNNNNANNLGTMVESN